MRIVLIVVGIVVAIIAIVSASIFLVKSVKKRSMDILADGYLGNDSCGYPIAVLFLILGIGTVFTGFLLSGKTINYTGAFSIKLPEDWKVSPAVSDFSDLGEDVSVYTNQDSVFAIGVTQISKDDEVKFKTDLKDAEKQRAAEIKAIKDRELKAIAKKEKYNVQKIRGIKWLAETDTRLKTMFNKRMYTITGYGDYNALIDTLTIKPFGGFRGIIDGYLIPVQGIRGIFSKSVYPHKTVNNGFFYLLGFIVGALVFALLLIWLVAAIVACTKSVAWDKKWNAMVIQEKIEHITDIYKDKHEENINDLKKAEKDYKKKVKAYNGQDPENALKEFKKTPLPEAKFFSNLLSAGKAGLEAMQEHYKIAVSVYEYYKSRYTASNARAGMINTEYVYLRKKGELYVNEIKKIKEEYVAKFGLGDLNALSASGPADLDIEDFDYDNIQDALESMEELFVKYDIKAEERWNNTFDFVFDSLLDDNKSIEESLIESGLALAISAVGQYFDNWQKSTEAKEKLVENEHEIVKAIKVIEKNQNRVDAFAAREENLNAIISKSLDWYTQKFNTVYAMMYPHGDVTKEQMDRKEREAQGGEYYTPEEKKEVALLILITQKTFKFLNADI